MLTPRVDAFESGAISLDVSKGSSHKAVQRHFSAARHFLTRRGCKQGLRRSRSSRLGKLAWAQPRPKAEGGSKDPPGNDDNVHHGGPRTVAQPPPAGLPMRCRKANTVRSVL
jgi:hypothetical protein